MAPLTTRWKAVVALLSAVFLLFGLFFLAGGSLGVYSNEWPDDAIVNALTGSNKSTDDSRLLGVSLRLLYCVLFLVLGGWSLSLSVRIPFRADHYVQELKGCVGMLRRLLGRGG